MNPASNFLKELVNRFFQKSPKFFQIIQIIASLLSFAMYIPSMLQRWFNVEVPGNIITLCEDIAKYAIGFFGASLLPVQQKPVAQTDEGKAVVVVDEKKLPFTAKTQEKMVDQTDPPPPVVPQVPDKPSQN